MLRLCGYGAKNLRSLRDTGLVHLRPITILVGKNSAGKSSFARILPLLKQSAERRKQAPLLWFGRLVDFGSFDEACSSFATEAAIEFMLRFAGPSSLFLRRRATLGAPNTAAPPEDAHIDVTLKLSSDSTDGRTVVRQLSIDVFGVAVRVLFEHASSVKLQIAENEIPPPIDGEFIAVQGSIIPVLTTYFRSQPSSTPVSDAALFEPAKRERLGRSQMRSAISWFVHGNTAPERMDEIADQLPIATLSELLKSCRDLTGAPDTWHSNLSHINENSVPLKRLQVALVLYHLERLLIELDEAMQNFCIGVSYLEPLRATAQRYYRREEVSIDEIDPKGLNTTFFVQGLTTRERENLNKWLIATFGFSLSVINAGGHASLNIDTGRSGQVRNMADVGLGYSQLAPVAIQLWDARRRTEARHSRVRVPAANFAKRRATVVIEQPELHLHPAYQSKLADLFVRSVKLDGYDDYRPAVGAGITVVAETHSQNLIGRLGDLVGQSQISSNDVQVLVFEPDPEFLGASKVRTAQFDSDGVLQNWPIGFFDY